MTKYKYKPYWLILLQTLAVIGAVVAGIALLVWAALTWWWFSMAAIVTSFVLLVLFVIWVDQGADS